MKIQNNVILVGYVKGALLIKVYNVDLGKSQFYLASTFEEDDIASSLNQSFTVNPNNHLFSYPKIINISYSKPMHYQFKVI